MRELRKARRARTTRPGRRWRALADAKRSEPTAHIAEARRVLDRLDVAAECACATLEDCGRALRAAE